MLIVALGMFQIKIMKLISRFYEIFYTLHRYLNTLSKIRNARLQMLAAPPGRKLGWSAGGTPITLPWRFIVKMRQKNCIGVF